MTKISPELAQQLRVNPADSVDLIVRTQGDASFHLDWLNNAGFQVKQQFRLVPGVAVRASGQAALQLVNQDWVLSIESDAPVSTM